MRILLIDDNLDQITITKRALRRHADCEFETASTAQEGLQKVLARDYDVILCDYRLPGMNGLELFQQLKTQGKEVPFIVITAAGNERVAVDAIRQGAADYVVKDASYEMLLGEIIQRAVEHFRHKQQLAYMETDRNQALEALKKERDALEAANKVMFDREGRVLELKDEVNALLKELGRDPKYGV